MCKYIRILSAESCVKYSYGCVYGPCKCCDASLRNLSASKIYLHPKYLVSASVAASVSSFNCNTKYSGRNSYCTDFIHVRMSVEWFNNIRRKRYHEASKAKNILISVPTHQINDFDSDSLFLYDYFKSIHEYFICILM